ncbi:LLM class flavin-dependent oxidoreductase [Streptomyces sp. NPDC057199]|uniref:LLM class flavin-dependent oxidoreductase n=1 Tax=Streptomyces sp. NPDC057199 TaxID=3346047 RepID=UPI0036377903
MKFGIVSACQVNRGMSYGVRVREVLKEIAFADELGFDFAGVSEQHFAGGIWACSAPELVMTALAMRTTRIKLRHMALVNLGFNHPIRSAERLATLDILSGGRVEVATARSNNAVTMKAFGLDPSTTRENWAENFEIMVRALSGQAVKFDGKHYQVDAPPISPSLESLELPPLYITATSLDSHYSAGKMGLNCMTADTWVGWDFQKALLDEYRRGLAEAEPIADLYKAEGHVTAFTFPAYCADTKAKAFDDARVEALGLMQGVSGLAEGLIKTKAPGYQYWADFAERYNKHGDNLEYLNDSTPMLMIGDPDFFIERCKQLEAMGMDEVVLKIDGYGHSKTMKTIELIGKYVIPEFKSRRGSIPENEFVKAGVPNVGRWEL